MVKVRDVAEIFAKSKWHCTHASALKPPFFSSPHHLLLSSSSCPANGILDPPRRSNDSDDYDYDRLMSAVTPVSSPARTRKRNADHLDSDHLDSDDAPPSSLNLALQRVNGNHLESIIAFAKGQSGFEIRI
ncbi:hypothetical protein DFH08DRAFT_948047 [Mycena albidolilacea]|uniref:Uncharacterized protein n=1 Tax=Mycena albidolilacea TaxID=1033008 RepID=A0AAD7AWU3_9AGAR|nr:hypothetical protein DFH08DRAFT_948047 [Mycena albidolilacea]